MDRHALAARDVADDFLAANRVAAAGAEDHQVVEPAHLDLLVAGPEDSPHDRRDSGLGRLLQLLLGHQLREERLRRELPVADRRKELVGLRHAELGGGAREAVVLGERLHVQAEAPRVLLEQLSPELDALDLLFGMDEVLDLAARARRADDVQPVAAGLVPGVVMISTMSPLRSRVRSGTILPLTRAPTH